MDSKLNQFHENVGGFLEAVFIKDMLLVMDEEGMLKNKPVNARASAMAGQTIRGDVIYIRHDLFEPPEPEQTATPKPPRRRGH